MQENGSREPFSCLRVEIELQLRFEKAEHRSGDGSSVGKFLARDPETFQATRNDILTPPSVSSFFRITIVQNLRGLPKRSGNGQHTEPQAPPAKAPSLEEKDENS